jgi:hypothetical protein
VTAQDQCGGQLRSTQHPGTAISTWHGPSSRTAPIWQLRTGVGRLRSILRPGMGHLDIVRFPCRVQWRRSSPGLSRMDPGSFGALQWPY